MNIDEFIEHTQETARKHRSHADFFDIDNPMRVACIKSAEDCEQLAEWLEKSKDYQQLEKQGRLIKLPCKVGDTVYVPTRNFISELRITEVVYNRDGTYLRWVLLSGIYPNLNGFVERKIGNEVFLTKSEAEAKLKELRGNND